MARPVSKPRRTHERESVREELLESARQLFAAKGFEGASLKELAEATGHNAALVNYYFESKEGLYRECVQPIFDAETNEVAFALRPAKCRQDFVTRFELFVEHFVGTHMRQEEICIILHRDLHTEVVKQLFKQHVHTLHDKVLSFLRSGRRYGFVRKDIDPPLLAKAVMSTLFSLISTERFREELEEPTFLDEKRRASTVRQLTQLFLTGFLNPESATQKPLS